MRIIEKEIVTTSVEETYISVDGIEFDCKYDCADHEISLTKECFYLLNGNSTSYENADIIIIHDKKELEIMRSYIETNDYYWNIPDVAEFPTVLATNDEFYNLNWLIKLINPIKDA